MREICETPRDPQTPPKFDVLLNPPIREAPSMFGIATLLIGLGTGILGGVGLISPFMGASFAVVLSSAMQLSFLQTLGLTVFGYFTPFFASSYINSKGLSLGITASTPNQPEEAPEEDVQTLGDESANQPLLLGLLKAGALAVALMLPAFKLSTVTGAPILAIASGLLLYTHKELRSNSLRLLGCIALQTITWSLGFTLISALNLPINPIFAVIAGSTLPTILLRNEDDGLYASSPSSPHLKEPIRPLWFISGITTMLLMPGYSASALFSCLFSNTPTRKLYAASLEGFLEGWVLKLVLSAQHSAKTPLGDLLIQTPFSLSSLSSLFSLGSLTPLLFIVTCLLCACIVGLAWAQLLTHLELSGLTLLSTSTSTCFVSLSLVLQSLAGSGLIASILLISLGFLNYAFRTLLNPKDSYSHNLVYLVQTL